MGRGVGVAVGTREMRDWPQVGVRSRERAEERFVGHTLVVLLSFGWGRGARDPP